MALNFSEDAELATRSEAPSEDYPNGTFQDYSTSESNDGTPASKARIVKSYDGFFQALLRWGKKTVSGLPDTAQLSDYFDALSTRFGPGITITHADTEPDNIGARTYSTLTSESVGNYAEQGAAYRLGIYLIKGGIQFVGNIGSRNVVKRTAAYDITGSLVFSTSSELEIGSYTYHFIKYAPITKLVLVGIPKTARIYRVSVEMRNATIGSKGADLAYEIDYTAGEWPVLESASGMWAGVGGINGESTINIEFDPWDVD